MVRNYKRKTSRPNWKEQEEMKAAIDEVRNGGLSMYAAAKKFTIPEPSLRSTYIVLI